MTNAIPGTTVLALSDKLPLTCTRAGTCCHGKMVWLNPWELAQLANEKGLTPRDFRDRYCEFGGIRLRFNGPPGWKGLAACSQYVPNHGCSVYAGRPLVCRLYPIGRMHISDECLYIHRGSLFPCLECCQQVVDLPHLTVADYLVGQKVSTFETAQDKYLDLMLRLADGAFVLLLESGLAASGDQMTLRLWRKLSKKEPQLLVKYLGTEWTDMLMIPEIGDSLSNPSDFTGRHYDMLQEQAQSLFGNLSEADTLRQASGLMMGMALHLGRGLGANPAELVGPWIATAKEHGAQE